MGIQGFRDILGDPYVYQETVSAQSVATGVDTTGLPEAWGVWSSPVAGAVPVGPANIYIELTTNGNIGVVPPGVGNILLGGVVGVTSANPTIMTIDSITHVVGETLNPTVNMITILDSPVNPTDGTNKAYVDSVVSQLNFEPATYAGTTGTDLGGTYANGAAGVGATLTNAGTQVAFSVDGVTPPINSRILVKDQTTTFQNGIYVLTTTGSGSSNWILTRATNFDTPAQIHPADIVPVEFGTINANTFWIQTATVTAVGTDPILFSPFFGGGVTMLTGNSGIATVLSSNINVIGTTNQITTTGSGSTLTISIPTTFIAPGTITSTGLLTASAGLSVTGTVTLGTPLGVAQGGTGSTSYTTDGVIYYNGTALVSTSSGLATQVLTSNGPGLAPTYQVIPTGGVTSVTGTVNEITAAPTTGAVILTIPATFIAPGTITSTGLLTASAGLTVTGTVTLGTALSVGNGGTGNTTYTTDGVIYYNGTTLASTSAGLATQVLTSNGAGVAPTYQALPITGVTSVTGTVNEITASPTTGAVILTIPSVFIAPGSIASTTTITAGTGLTITSGGLNVTGTVTLGTALTVGQGGTGSTTYTTDGVIYYNGTVLASTSAGLATQVLTSNGAGVAPTYQAIPITGVTSVTGTANQITASPTTGAVVLTIPSTFIAPGTITSTGLLTASAGLTVTGTVTLGTPLAVGQGGTGNTTYTTDGVIYYNGTTLVSTSAGVATQVLTSNGPGLAPTYQAISASGVTSITGTANQITASASTGAVTLSTPSVFIAPGSIASTTTISVGTNLLMPVTTHTVGQVIVGGVLWMHNYQPDNIFIGNNAGNLTLNTNNIENIAIGTNAGNSFGNGGTGSHNNVFVGYGSGALSRSSQNVGVGSGTLAAAVLSGNNTALGYNAGTALTTASTDNVLIGVNAALNATNNNDRNVVVGGNSGGSWTTASADNIIIGQAVTGIASEVSTLRIGQGTGTGSGNLQAAFIQGIAGVAVSTAAYVTINTTTGQLGSTAIPAGGVTSITGTANQITASSSTGAVTLSIPINFIIPGSLTTTTSISLGTNIGLPATSSTAGNIQSGGSAIIQFFGTNNIFMGLNAGNYSLTTATAVQNVAIGTNAGNALTTGNNNTILGYNAGASVAAQSNAVIIGSGAGGVIVGSSVIIGALAGAAVSTSSTNNVLIGYQSGNALTTTSANNVFLGFESVLTATSGTVRNTVIGSTAGSSWTTSSNDNILIGYGVTGAAGDANTLRIGQTSTAGTGGLTKAFIQGIYNTTVAGSAVYINIITGQLALLTSSRKFKNTIQDMSDLSSDIYKLRPVTFLYNKNPEMGVQYGLVAEEVEEIIPQLAVKDQDGQIMSVKYEQLPAMLLNELQKLAKRVEELESKIRGSN